MTEQKADALTNVAIYVAYQPIMASISVLLHSFSLPLLLLPFSLPTNSLILARIPTSIPVQVSGSSLLPDGFSCSRAMPRCSSIYSTPGNSNLPKVDLVHTLCGQIYTAASNSSREGRQESSSGVRVGGFHARPGDVDPASASTAGPYSQLVRTAPDQNGYAVYKYPYIYDITAETGRRKDTSSISSIWPTALSLKEIVEVITELVYACSPGQGKHLCVADYSVAPEEGTEFFDVVIILWKNGRVVRSGYPVRRGACSGKSSSAFDICCYNSTIANINKLRQKLWTNP